MQFSVNNICKSYGSHKVLSNFSYTFDEGLYLLTGVNGCGKSTLLKIMSKVIYPSNTNYTIDKLKVAYLCEKMELVNTNVKVFLKDICKINKKKMNIKEIIKKWNIPNKNISNLSKGNKQKVSLIMMILLDCDVYLFDEPTDALDKESIRMFTEFIKELMNKKIVIITTHEKDYFKDLNYKEVRLECLG